MRVRPFRFLLATFALSTSLTPLAAGCGSDDSGTDSANLTQKVSFEPLEVTREGAPAGLTVLKNTADYRAFFGDDAPAIDFQRSWVVHYSMGIKSTGGFTTEITSIEKTGASDNRKLVVHTNDVSPGAGCSVTKALTNPQVAVRINKQPSTPSQKAASEKTTTNCSEVDCGDLDDRAVDVCFGDDSEAPDWDSCFEGAFEDLGDVRQQAKDCCDDGGPFSWCLEFNNGGFDCEPSGGSCADEHVGCDAGQVENEDLSCPQVDSHSTLYCCVPEN